MIVLGADTHERSHAVAAVAAATGGLLGGQTVQVGRRGFGALLRWARGLDGDRVWAREDCRHVCGSLERFLIEGGERVLRIPTHLTANARRSARQRASRIRSTRSTSPAPRCRRAFSPSRPRIWTDRNSTAAAGRPPRTAGRSSRRAQQHGAVASARSVARVAASGRRVVLEEVQYPHRPASRPRAADDARSDRA